MGNRSIQRRLDADGVQITQIKPQGELLPAEERLQNVLKAIEDRLKVEQMYCRDLEDQGLSEAAYHRNFVNGLDIAWSLAQTEILRRGRCSSKFTRAGLLPGLNECELEHGHVNLHSSTTTGGFHWSDTDAD